MINHKFLKIQIKSSIWIALGIAIIPISISILSMSFTPYFFDTTINISHGTISYSGAISLLKTTLFGTVGEIIGLAFGVALAIKLINIEISKGYMASWLNLPMTRTNFFATKVLSILIASIIVVFPNFLVELIIVTIKHYPDFNLTATGIIFKANFGLLLIFLLISAITVTFSIIFNQTSHALTLSIVVPLVFILLFLFSTISDTLNLQFLKYLKYLTFFTFYDFKQLMQSNDNNFIWKFFLLFILSSGLFFFAGYWFNKKNLYI